MVPFLRDREHFLLSRLEIENVFFQVSRALGPQATRQLAASDLEAALQGSATFSPEAQWAESSAKYVKELVVDVNRRHGNAGSSLQTVFARGGQEAVDLAVVRAEFSRWYDGGLGEHQWGTLAAFVDKDSDGRVRWRATLRWAGVI